ncbi:hypothetical protein FB451DRAFT_1080722 [Mycena latifolia]|nr:hypothetical protein FB451DRAFT_1080722 [Mycena latifolia]
MSIQAPRKLLVLDLNGTLLLRSKRVSARSLGGVRARTVHPRPYLKPFREYIFHPSTMAWLDSMVWSSAQPPSVADMVHHCFGDVRHKFVAVWARDTLGLPPALYHRKTQTTKDLKTVWAAFPAHGARTTLLLDDSALKAHLYPHNHVCVPEYLAAMRARDVEVLLQTIRVRPAKPPKKAKNAKKAKNPDLEERPEDVATRALNNPHLPSPPLLPQRPTKYDETLLAVVGILEALKTEADVAQWIRGGGLAGKSVKQAGNSRHPSLDSLVCEMDALNLAPEPWFNSEITADYWAAQGVHALKALQIDVEAGIQNNDV